jgi:hypothetical protein
MAQYKSNEDYQKELLIQFDELSSQELKGLISKCKNYLPKFEVEDSNRDYLISNIITQCEEMKQITFNQWKALSAFSRDCTKLEMVNNKVKSLVDPIEVTMKPIAPTPMVQQSYPSGFIYDAIDPTTLTPAQLESYLQNKSKNELTKEMQRAIEERFGNVYEITKDGKAIKKPKAN